MKTIAILLMTMLSLNLFAQNDYVLELDGNTYEISLDNAYSLTIDGKTVNFKVIPKDTLIYKDEFFSFKYPKDYKITKMEIDEGINQVMVMTPEGSGFLIQKYSTMNPTILNNMMMREVTKESVEDGYSVTRKDYARTIKSGQVLEIDKSILSNRSESNIYEVATIGDNDEGILILTIVSVENMSKSGKSLIDMMWSTLAYK